MRRLTQAMAIQQHKPVRMGFPPLFTNRMMLVFQPMAAMAMTMRNLLSSFNGSVTEAGS